MTSWWTNNSTSKSSPYYVLHICICITYFAHFLHLQSIIYTVVSYSIMPKETEHYMVKKMSLNIANRYDSLS